MPAGNHGVVVFHTTSAAIKADKVLRQTSLSTKLVPTPRHLSSDCGLAIRFDWTNREVVARTLEDNGVEAAGYHELKRPPEAGHRRPGPA
jgi:hypothetical protein